MLLVNGKQIETDKEGYLKHLADWTEEVAVVIATNEGLLLTDEHWEIVYFLREFYQEHKTTPAIRMLVRVIAKKLGEEKGNSRYLHRLFPLGPARQGCKIGGLPKPIHCL